VAVASVPAWLMISTRLPVSPVTTSVLPEPGQANAPSEPVVAGVASTMMSVAGAALVLARPGRATDAGV